MGISNNAHYQVTVYSCKYHLKNFLSIVLFTIGDILVYEMLHVFFTFKATLFLI